TNPRTPTSTTASARGGEDSFRRATSQRNPELVHPSRLTRAAAIQMPLFDLSDRIKLRFTGSDRVRFLNGQVTNDIRKANANLSMPACVLSAKGKMDGLIFVNAGKEDFFVDADPELKETLAARLERSLIADDVVMGDVP